MISRPHIVKLGFKLPRTEEKLWPSGEIFAVVYLPPGETPRREQLADAVRPLVAELKQNGSMEGVEDLWLEIVAELPARNGLLWEDRRLVEEDGPELESTTLPHARVYWPDEIGSADNPVRRLLLSLADV